MKSLVVVAALSCSVLAAPVAPGKLPQVNPKPTGRGPQVTLYATELPADHVIRLVNDGDFVMIANPHTFEGRIETPVPAAAAIHAVLRGDLAVPARGGAGAVDLDFYDAPVVDLIRLLADVTRADLVYAPSKPPPKLSLRIKRGDPIKLARQIAKLTNLDLIERGSTWIVVDAGTKLDAKLLAITAKGVQLRLHGARPGEAEQLLDPKAPPGRCPTDRTIDARLRRGQIGAVLAVAATIQGPACTVASSTRLAKDGKLVGILRSPTEKRAAFRLAAGTQLWQPTQGDDLGESFVKLGADAVELYPPLATPSIVDDPREHAPCGAQAAARTYVLRATAKVGKQWRALFLDKDGRAHQVTESAPAKTAITAGRVQCDGGPSYVLSTP